MPAADTTASKDTAAIEEPATTAVLSSATNRSAGAASFGGSGSQRPASGGLTPEETEAMLIQVDSVEDQVY